MNSQFPVRGSSRRSMSVAKPLKRGQACVNCRSLKIKCDGAKPSCGPCLRNPRMSNCEYTEDLVNTRTRQLEETVAQLQARIADLEHTGHHHSPVTEVALSNPYQPSSSHTHMLPPLSLEQTTKLETWSDNMLPPSPYHHEHISPSSPFSREQFTSSSSPHHHLEPAPLHSSPSSSSSPSSYNASDIARDLPPAWTESLLMTFSAVASELGFFLDFAQFRESCRVPLPHGYSQPLPGLLNAVFVISAHMTSYPELARYEQTFLRHALQETVIGLESPDIFRVVQTIQAEVLLSYYFLQVARPIEAKRHCSSAVALALTCGLHKLRPLTAPNMSGGLLSHLDPNFLRPVDGHEYGQLVNAFWSVFALHKLLSVAVDPPSSLCGALEAPGLVIDTPWPMETDGYGQGLMLHHHGEATVQRFLSGADSSQANSSPFASFVKATAVYHRAAELAGQWGAGAVPDYNKYAEAYNTLDGILQNLSVDLDATASPNDPTLVLARALIHAANVKLHGISYSNNFESRKRCLLSARMLIEVTSHLADRPCVNPIYGTIWMDSCCMLSHEYRHLNHQSEHTYDQHPTIIPPKDISSLWKGGFDLMTAHAAASAFISALLSRMRPS